jgi:hypothetical protein
VDRWIKLRYSGRRHSLAAWEARGQGWAKDVSPEAWARFNSLSRLARTDLVEAWRLRPDRPEAAFLMMGVSEDDPVPGENPRLWFDRTIAAQLDYLGAYGDMLRLLLPRWGGSHEEMLAFGREAAATGRFDTDVPFFALRAARSIYDDQKSKHGEAGDSPVYRWPDTYPLLADVLEGYTKAQPQRADYYHSMWAIVAARAGRNAEALTHLKAAGFRLTVAAASSLEDETADEFVRRIALSVDPAAADAAVADARRQSGDVAGALAGYRAALPKAGSPQARAALEQRIVALEHEGRLQAGDWARLLPASNGLEGWRPLFGSWTSESDGAVTGTVGARGLLLVSDVHVGPYFEMKGRVELVSTSNGAFQGGVVFGHPWIDYGKAYDKWFSFRVKRNPREGSVAYFSRHFYLPDGPPPAVAVGDINDIHVRVDSHGMSAWLNGRLVQQGYVPKGEWDQQDATSVVGLGAYGDENLVRLRFRDVQVRRLHRD